jgi:hypothetical protein
MDKRISFMTLFGSSATQNWTSWPLRDGKTPLDTYVDVVTTGRDSAIFISDMFVTGARRLSVFRLIRPGTSAAFGHKVSLTLI